MSSILEGYGSQFFQDQNVFAKDLNAIDYSKTKMFRDYLHSITKVPGVFLTDPAVDTPLKVTTTDGSTFSVNAGTAVDPYGRMIQVPVSPLTASGSLSTSPLYYPTRPDRVNLVTGVVVAGTYYINLEYAMIEADLRSDDAGEQHYTRVYDSYKISVSTTVSSLGITLAKVVLLNDGTIDTDMIGGGYAGKALYDQRVAFEKFEGQFNAVNTTLAAHTVDLAETLEKSIGFLYPANNIAFYTQIPRDATITAFSVFVGGTGTVVAHLWVGLNNASLVELTSTSATNYNFSEVVLSSAYTQNYLIKVSIDGVTGIVDACTAIIKYQRA